MSQRDELIAERMTRHHPRQRASHGERRPGWPGSAPSRRRCDRAGDDPAGLVRALPGSTPPTPRSTTGRRRTRPRSTRRWATEKTSFKADCTVVSEDSWPGSRPHHTTRQGPAPGPDRGGPQCLDKAPISQALAREVSDARRPPTRRRARLPRRRPLTGRAVRRSWRRRKICPLARRFTPLVETSAGFHLLSVVNARPDAAGIELVGRRCEFARRGFVRFKSTGSPSGSATTWWRPRGRRAPGGDRGAAWSGPPSKPRRGPPRPGTRRRAPRPRTPAPLRRGRGEPAQGAADRPVQPPRASDPRRHGQRRGAGVRARQARCCTPQPIPTGSGYAVVALVEKKPADRAEFTGRGSRTSASASAPRVTRRAHRVTLRRPAKGGGGADRDHPEPRRAPQDGEDERE
jgi:hypothetical protein